jgi:hypothetical protein
VGHRRVDETHRCGEHRGAGTGLDRHAGSMAVGARQPAPRTAACGDGGIDFSDCLQGALRRRGAVELRASAHVLAPLSGNHDAAAGAATGPCAMRGRHVAMPSESPPGCCWSGSCSPC